MTRQEFITYPAVSASRIKKYYTGSIDYARVALRKGASFHEQLLERSIDEMDIEASNVHKCIIEHPISSMIFNGALKEYPEAKNIEVYSGLVVTGKACYDVYNENFKIIADVKTTSAKSLEKFQYDMINHCNHIQAVWYCMVSGIDPKNYFYIGVPPNAKKNGSTADDIYVCRHSFQEIENAKELIKNYFRHQRNEIEKFVVSA